MRALSIAIAVALCVAGALVLICEMSPGIALAWGVGGVAATAAILVILALIVLAD